MVQTVALDIATFRTEYPDFSDKDFYPDARIDWAFKMSEIYLTDRKGWAFRTDAILQQALYLCSAHVLTLTGPSVASSEEGAELLGSGGMGASGIITGATIDKVSVQFQGPTAEGDLKYWLAQTAWGQMLLALMRKLATAFYVGGLPEKKAFRRVGGVFTNR